MKIYTKTGDNGTTSLVYGSRVSKTDARVEAYGTCDEANSMIGLGLSYLNQETFEGKDEFMKAFHRVQTNLFHVGAELATPADKEVKWTVSEDDISQLETYIDLWDGKIPSLDNFILPGGHPSSAALHVARTVVRRAERKAVSIGGSVNPLVNSYLNRLSDFLFVAARYLNFIFNVEDVKLHQ
ncbi:cob(I)yrinic acid a,c-diamide adenosyltransferase [Bacillus sp. Marseille-P3661]|uniref:cob(I)yrinic acid a,c-diamide adenosyltransferase n=1 Tax=Bacillus sp. Marseille-P3661 TaxID=1936234 RepID=UPI000C847A89|nr:cob(I)yrinic acid a,c-diamide adenosyltransferase [Bacillus sp. Marseille-P3661]